MINQVDIYFFELQSIAYHTGMYLDLVFKKGKLLYRIRLKDERTIGYL
jgi:hypothetical protein